MKNKFFPYKFIDASVESLNAEHHTTTKVIYLTIVLSLIVGICVLPFINVNISTQSRGILKTKQENNQVTTGIYGQISAVFMENNKPINLGDTLLILNTLRQEEKIRLNQEKIKENRKFIEDLNQLIGFADKENPVLNTSIYHHEFIQYSQKVAEHQLKLAYKKNELDLAKKLVETGAVAGNELERMNFEHQLQISTLNSMKKQHKKTWQLELQRYKTENRELVSNNFQLDKEIKENIIVAPISGIITQYTGLQPNNFVSPNQIVAYISSNEELIVENYVSPSDIGLIHKGMDVKFQVDAFNYNQWGLAEGKVQSISGDIITMQDQPFFLVRCSMEQDYLQLKKGYRGKLKKGMTLNARFSITERTLFQLLYDKVDDWLNPTLG